MGLPAATATLNFNNCASVVVVNSVIFRGNLTTAVSTNGNLSVAVCGTNQTVAFHANLFAGNDDDLTSPFLRASNTSDEVDLKMVPVIGGPVDSPRPAEPDTPTPDDESKGGSIRFAFNHLVNFRSVDYVDPEDNGTELGVNFFGDGNTLLGLSGDLVAGNKQFETFVGAFSNVRSIEFDFRGPGALNNLSAVAVPVLVSGLTLVRLVRNRRRKT